MIIRSQDKRFISTNLNLKIYQDDWSKKFEISNDTGAELGFYSTEEKAIKVLDMIQEKYIEHYTLEDILGSVQGVIVVPKCFQMPQDNEVEV